MSTSTTSTSNVVMPTNTVQPPFQVVPVPDQRAMVQPQQQAAPQAPLALRDLAERQRTNNQHIVTSMTNAFAQTIMRDHMERAYEVQQQSILDGLNAALAAASALSTCQFVRKIGDRIPCSKIAARKSKYCSTHKYRAEKEDRLKRETHKRKRYERLYRKRPPVEDDDQSDDESYGEKLFKRRRGERPTPLSPDRSDVWLPSPLADPQEDATMEVSPSSAMSSLSLRDGN